MLFSPVPPTPTLTSPSCFSVNAVSLTVLHILHPQYSQTVRNKLDFSRRRGLKEQWPAGCNATVLLPQERATRHTNTHTQRSKHSAMAPGRTTLLLLLLLLLCCCVWVARAIPPTSRTASPNHRPVIGKSPQPRRNLLKFVVCATQCWLRCLRRRRDFGARCQNAEAQPNHVHRGVLRQVPGVCGSQSCAHYVMSEPNSA